MTAHKPNCPPQDLSKTGLTPEEKLRVVHAHLIIGVSQHDLASIFNVNSGRVAEAVKEVKAAINWSVL